MKILLYDLKIKKLKTFNWDEYYILNELLNYNLRIPKISDNKKLNNNNIDDIKIKISTLNDFMPLYNINIRNIQIIKKDDIFYKVKKEFYRFPDDYLINNISNILSNKSTKKNVNFHNKLKNMYYFLLNFNLKVLKQSYINMIYENTNEIGKDITTFEKISYLPFLHKSIAFYSRKEIINMGLNFNFIKSDNQYYDLNKLKELYKKIIKYDFNAKTLLNNIYYIYENDSSSVIKFYTFHGSYYMNYYLRNFKNNLQDELLEKLIKKLWNIILKAPIIKKEKFVYRFISDDFFLENLNINDIYIDRGFISTTRNQFYDIDSDTFGYILLKIIIPNNSEGCLCVEPYSLFPLEEEVIFSPNSKFKLINKDLNVNYFHINEYSEKKIVRKYEFIYEGSNFTNKFFKKDKENIKTYDFYSFNLKGKNLVEKINFFYEEIIRFNKNNKFYMKINNKKILFYCDFYNSKDVYNKFFSLKKQNGFYFYSLNENGYYEYFIEINKQLHINYFMKYINTSNYSNDLFDVISSIGYLFKINYAILYNSYKSNKIFYKNKIKDDDTLNINSAFITNYNEDLYNYLKYKKKMYDNNFIHPNFNYFYLDILFNLPIDDILNINDSDKLYYIYNNYYNLNNNFAEFYIYIIENYWYLIDELNNKLNKYYLYYDINLNLNYIFNINLYLKIKNKFTHSYENKIIPDFDDNDEFKMIFNKNYKKKLRSIEY